MDASRLHRSIRRCLVALHAGPNPKARWQFSTGFENDLAINVNVVLVRFIETCVRTVYNGSEDSVVLILILDIWRLLEKA